MYIIYVRAFFDLNPSLCFSKTENRHDRLTVAILAAHTCNPALGSVSIQPSHAIPEAQRKRAFEECE